MKYQLQSDTGNNGYVTLEQEQYVLQMMIIVFINQTTTVCSSAAWVHFCRVLPSYESQFLKLGLYTMSP